jgi:hypothetical protein
VDRRRRGGQHAQQHELLLRQLDGPAAEAHDARRRIDLERPDAHPSRAPPPVGTPQQRRRATAQGLISAWMPLSRKGSRVDRPGKPGYSACTALNRAPLSGPHGE